MFNKALALQKTNHEAGEKFIGDVAMAKHLTDWRNGLETPWLKDAPCHPLQSALKDLERAYKNFFAKRARFPRFKRKGNGESFRYPDAKQFKLDAGKWYLSIQTECEVAQPVPTTSTAIGIDMGITRFVTLSDGTFYAPLNSFKKHEQRLARYQRRMSRKVKFSKNWHKAKRRVRNTHTRISNARRDYLHKTSTTISQNHALVCIKDLQVRNMSKSATGDLERPGKNVKAKSGLNKAILDQGWFEFRRQLEYKLNWNGGTLVTVPAHNTSQTCPCCGHVSGENHLSQANFFVSIVAMRKMPM